MNPEEAYCPRVFSKGCVGEIVLFSGVAGSMVLWTLALDGWADLVWVLTMIAVLAYGREWW